MSGKAESYNETFKDSKSSIFCKEFVRSNSKVDFVTGDETDWDEEDDDQICSEAKQAKPFFWEMSR